MTVAPWNLTFQDFFKVFMGKIDNDILSKIIENVTMAKCFQYLVPLKNHKQNKFLYWWFLLWQCRMWFVAEPFSGKMFLFIFLIIIVTTAVNLCKTKDCGFLLKNQLSVNNFVSYKFVLYWFIRVPGFITNM